MGNGKWVMDSGQRATDGGACVVRHSPIVFGCSSVFLLTFSRFLTDAFSELPDVFPHYSVGVFRLFPSMARQLRDSVCRLTIVVVPSYLSRHAKLPELPRRVTLVGTPGYVGRHTKLSMVQCVTSIIFLSLRPVPRSKWLWEPILRGDLPCGRGRCEALPIINMN